EGGPVTPSWSVTASAWLVVDACAAADRYNQPAYGLVPGRGFTCVVAPAGVYICCPISSSVVAHRCWGDVVAAQDGRWTHACQSGPSSSSSDSCAELVSSVSGRRGAGSQKSNWPLSSLTRMSPTACA